MEDPTLQKPTFTIEPPREGDEVPLAPMHIQAWKETYVFQHSGLTNELVDEFLEHIRSDLNFRKNTIRESLQHPEQVFYRVVKNHRGNIVGFMHGSKNEEFNELEGLYLLNEAKGTGVSGKLMEEFLLWGDAGKPSRLEVFAFNAHAINFYERYGFRTTETPIPLYKNMLPGIEMVRDANGAL